MYEGRLPLLEAPHDVIKVYASKWEVYEGVALYVEVDPPLVCPPLGLCSHLVEDVLVLNLDDSNTNGVGYCVVCDVCSHFYSLPMVKKRCSCLHLKGFHS